MELYLNTTLSELLKGGIINNRISHYLTMEGIYTIEELLAIYKTPERLLTIRNIGSSSIKKLECLYEKKEWTYRKDDGSSTEEISFRPDTYQYISEFIGKAYNRLLGNADIGESAPMSPALLCMRLHDKQLPRIFSIVGGVSYEDTMKIRKFYRDVLMLSLSMVKQARSKRLDIIKWLEKQVLAAENYTKDVTEEEYVRHYMPVKTFQTLQQTYETLAANELSTNFLRALQRNLMDFDDAIRYMHQDKYRLEEDFAKKMTQPQLDEIFRFIQHFALYYHVISKRSGLRSILCQMKKTFQMDMETKFVTAFYRKNGYFPLLHMLDQCLGQRRSQEMDIMNSYLGHSNSCPVSIKKLAQQHGLTFERVRQIVHGISFIGKLHLDTGILTAPGSPYHKPSFIRLVDVMNSGDWKKEMYDVPADRVAGVMALLNGYRLFEFKGYKALLTKEMYKAVKSCQLVYQLNKFQEMKVIEGKVLNIHDLLYKCPPNRKEEMRHFIDELCRMRLGFEADSDGNLTVPQEQLRIEKLVRGILQEKGSAMSLLDLSMTVNRKNPKMQIVEPSKLVQILKKSSHIHSVDNRALYGLKEWQEGEQPQCADALYRYLEEKDEPVPISQLMEHITRLFPQLVTETVVNCMMKDHLCRFSKFQQDNYGLSARIYPDLYIAVPFQEKGNLVLERIHRLQEFIRREGRLPMLTEPEEKQLVYRYNWLKFRSYTFRTEEALLAENFIRMAERTECPHNQNDIRFQQKCKDFREYVGQVGKKPTYQDNKPLYFWWRKNLREQAGMNAFKKKTFEELLTFMENKGLKE